MRLLLDEFCPYTKQNRSETTRTLAYFTQLKLNVYRQSEIQKHVKIFLNSKPDFMEHLKNVSNKISKTSVVLYKLHKILPTPPLITI